MVLVPAAIADETDEGYAYLSDASTVGWVKLVLAVSIEASTNDDFDINRLQLSGDVSGYRTLEEQKYLYKLYGPSRAAYPGSSPHGINGAMDFDLNHPKMSGVATTPEAIWLEQNAEKFGFVPCLKSLDEKYKGRSRYGPSQILNDDDELVNNYHEVWHWNYIGK